MNLGRELDFFMAQGPLFWAAAASVGLGGTLLVSSLFVWTRRRLHRAAPAFGVLRRGRRKASGPAGPTIEVTETGYAVEGAPRVLAPQATAPSVDRDQLGALLERLREAGDRLETALETPDTRKFHQRVLKPALELDEIETRVGVC